MFKDHHRHTSPNSAQSFRRRKWLLVALVSASLLLFYAALTSLGRDGDAYRSHFGSGANDTPAYPEKNFDESGSKTKQDTPPFRHRHVVVASEFGAHFDVYIAFAKTLHDVLSEDNATYPDWTLQVFAGTPLGHGFQEVVDRLKLYEGKFRHPDELDEAMKYDGSGEGREGENVIDLLVFGTCELDMLRWSDPLLAIYDARPADKKFELVCGVHNVRDTRWQHHIREWARRGAIRLLPIGSHVGHGFRMNFKELADSADAETYTAMYEYIPIDVHAPVLDIPDLVPSSSSSSSEHATIDPESDLDPAIDANGHLSNLADSGVPYPPTRSATLSRAVIQGNLESARRDYEHVFRDLVELMKADPGAWGYHPLSTTQSSFIPIKQETAEDPEPFTVTVMGEGEITIPTELTHVVVIRRGLSYWDFYRVMMSISVVVPAFGNGDYYDAQASSTIAMAVQCNTPILATSRIRRAYGYIDDDRVTITRPQAIREMEAIYLLRKQMFNFSDFASRHNITHGAELPELKSDVDAMLQAGWRRSTEGYDEFKKDLWRKNRASARRVIEGRRGLGAGITDY